MIIKQPSVEPAEFKQSFDDLKKGDFAKICFESKIDTVESESFWVEIVQVKNNSYLARIDNNLISADKWLVSYNDLIRIKPNNVLRTC